MGIAHEVAKKVGGALSSVHAGDDKLASKKVASGVPATLALKSSAFAPGERLPRSASAEGGSTAPAIEWEGVPSGAQSLVLLCEDPDAPFPEPYVHWMVYGIPAYAGALSGAEASRFLVGKNSKLEKGFTGAAPPPGHGLHHYHFQLFALDTELKLDDGEGRGALLDAMKGHIVAWGDLVGTFETN